MNKAEDTRLAGQLWALLRRGGQLGIHTTTPVATHLLLFEAPR